MSYNYETIPPGYYDGVFHKNQGLQSKWHHQKFQVVRKLLGSFENHLDIGCGPGTFIGTLTQPNGLSIGVDLALQQIDYANKHYGGPNKQFETIYPGPLPFPSNHFDAVTLVELLEHLPEKQVRPLLSEVLRVLTPGGRIIATTPNYGSLWPMLEWLLNRQGPINYEDQHITLFDRHSFEITMQSVGFDQIQVTGFQLFSPFMAILNWKLADLVARLEPAFLVNRLGFLLALHAIKPLKS